ncbi:Gfo/Idh/MocA family oxidoreductase [Amycolatopsis sp. NPDC051061]|uniref:Gfo/Idh/MocA family protein n=1 Tax=Amycolatopsis sp. NPDC051061 TaxID=3155042 RepID=UPI0034312AB8
MSAVGPGTPVRVAVVGLGWASREIWLPRLLRNPAYQVTAFVEPAEDARTAVLDELADSGLSEVAGYSDVDELPVHTVDLAVVAVPNHLHASVACRLLRRGVLVFLEKPLCLSSTEAADLAEAEKAGGAVLLGGSAARHRADVTALRELIPALGALRHIEVSWVRARGIPDRGGWFTSRTRSGGGALVDLGWHLLDVARSLLNGVTGSPAGVELEHAIGSVSADFINNHAFQAAWRGETLPDPVTGDVEDTARGFLVTRSGISVGVHASWASHQKLDTTVLRLDGSEGSAELHCTFGFSPNRADRPTLVHTSGGRSAPVELPVEAVGAEYDTQLELLPALLAHLGTRGHAAAEAGWVVSAIEQIYGAASATRCVEPASARSELLGTGATR